MDHRLHLLDSFDTVGSDGARHKVRVYERLVDDPSLPSDGRDHWEPSGLLEYRLDDGRPVEEAGDDRWRVVGGGLDLHRPATTGGPPARAGADAAAP